MKRIISLLACICLCACAVACGNQGTDGPQDSQAPASESSVNLLETINQYEGSIADYVQLGQYKGLQIEVYDSAATEAEIDAALKAFLLANTEYTETQNSAALDDIVNIDFTGYIDGETFTGGSGANYELTLGSGKFIKGFEDQLIGVKAGDAVSVVCTFPDDYTPASLAGQEATFEVKVNSVKTPQMTELTDEFVADNTSYATIEEYRSYLEQYISSANQSSAENSAKEVLWGMVVDNAELIAYPEGEVEKVIEYLEELYQQSAESYSMTFEDYRNQILAMDQEEYEAFRDKYAESIVFDTMVLYAVVEDAEITLTESEYQDTAGYYAAQLNYDSLEAAEASYGKVNLCKLIAKDKVNEMLYENAEISTVERTSE